MNKISMYNLSKVWMFGMTLAVALLCAGDAFAEVQDGFALHRAEFAKYHREITGRDAPDGAVRFAARPPAGTS